MIKSANWNWAKIGCLGTLILFGARAIAYSLQDHFKHPISPQSAKPKSWSVMETSLAPRDCAVCHSAQFEAWKGSRHAKAISPGFHGQMLDFVEKRKDGKSAGTYRLCLSCHGPLHEQKQVLKDGELNPDFDESLYKSGLSCSGCHVRQWQRHGPVGKTPKMKNAPHGGYTAHDWFSKSEFCGTCHQFKPGNKAQMLEGKLFEDTLAQWQASPFAKQGVQCQGCHMPDRQHLWRGINDKEMTLKGIDLQVQPPVAVNGWGRVGVRLKSKWVGHLFPTYLPPQVMVSFEFKDAQQKVLPSFTRNFRIGWFVESLSKEISDTRMKPGEEREFLAHWPKGEAKFVQVKVWVDPQEYYRRRFKHSLSKKPSQRVKTFYLQAIQNTDTLKYVLLDKKLTL